MNLYTNSLLIVNGIFVYMIFLHLLLVFKKHEMKINIWMIAMLVNSIIFNSMEYLQPLTINFARHYLYWRILVTSQSFIIITLMWFMFSYIEYHKNLVAKWLLTILWILLAIARNLCDYLLYYKEFHGFKIVVMPWGEELIYRTGIPTFFIQFYYLFVIASLLYIFIVAIANSKSKSKRNNIITIAIVYFTLLCFDIFHNLLPWNFVHIAPYGNLSISLIISLSIFSNIYKTEALEKRIRLQQERLNLAIQTTGAGFWDWNLPKDEIIFNDNWASMIGYSREELFPLSYGVWQKLVHTEDYKLAEIVIAEHFEGKTEVYSSQFRMKHKNGQWIWILATGKIIERDNAGQPVRMIGTHVNIDKIKRAEEALKKEKELLNAIMENIPIGIILVGSKGEIVFTNQHFHHITGYEKGEIGNTEQWFKVAYPDDNYREIVAKRWMEALNEEHVNINFKVCCKNREFKDIEFHSLLLEDNRIIVTMNDISEKLSQEKEIKETKELLDTALTQAPVGIMIADAPDIKIRVINKAALQMNGEMQEKLTNIDLKNHSLNWQTKYPDGNAYKIEDLPLSRAIFNGEYISGEEIIINDINDEEHFLLTNAAPIFGEDGKIIAGIVIFNDITKQKLAEKELTKAKKYIDNILNSMPSSLIGVDSNLNITHWNSEATKRSQISLDKAINAKLNKLIPEFAKITSEIKNSITDRKSITLPRIHSKKNDREIIEDIVIYPLISNGVEGAVIRIDDVTEKITMEEMMIQSEKMMSVGGLAAGMAHEINNPLAGMMQNSSVLLNRLSTDSKKNIDAAREAGTEFENIKTFMNNRNVLKLLELIFESGKRASELVSNMLSFARKSESKVKNTDMRQLMENTLLLVTNDYDMRKNYDFKKIEIVKKYSEELQDIECETTKIQQVFMNILKNGAEAMFSDDNLPDNPHFIIRISQLENWVRIEIENNGPIIPEKLKKRIFEPFFTTKEVGKGTGLGLSVSYFIITKNHRGKMWVENEEKSGTRFIIELPNVFEGENN